MKFNYRMGATVVFADSNATHNTAETVLHSGLINGEPLTEGDLVLVPCFCTRSDGREPTTVYVNENNIVSVKHPAEGGA